MRNRVYEFSRLLVLSALVVVGTAYARCVTQYQISAGNNTGVFSDPGSACQAAVTWTAALGGVSNATITAQSQTSCTVGYVFNGNNRTNVYGITAISDPNCAQECAAVGGTSEYVSSLDAVGAMSSSGTCYAGCALSAVPQTSMAIGPPSPGQYSTVMYLQYTGQMCGSTQAANPAVQSQCVNKGGTQICVEPAKQNCGTVNGDEVCLAVASPGTCVGYASGGVACTVANGQSATTPPAPNSGTSGTVATPTAIETTPAGRTVNYYNAAVVNASTQAVSTTGQRQNVGNAGSTSGSSTGSNVPNAANGDCGASGVDCTGDGTVPTLSNQDTIATTTSNYETALNSVPIVQAVAGIAASVPSGSCPTGTFNVYGHDYVINEQCTLWESVQSIVQLCMLAVWTFMGIRILMSA